MGRKTSRTTSLWAVIEGMQRRLEAEGLDREVVDAAVACGLEALLQLEADAQAPAADDEDRERPRVPAWLRARIMAKA
jgi:hypothetical protein